MAASRSIGQRVWTAVRVILFSAAVGSCAANPAPVVTATFSPLRSKSECPTARVVKGTPEEQQAIAEAMADVCVIFRSPAFAERVQARSWLTGCAYNPVSKRYVMAGPDVLLRLQSGVPDFTLSAEYTGGPSTVATTRIWERDMSIRPPQIALWKDSSRAVRGRLVNTLAHEMTHLIGLPGAPTRNQFTDSRYWLPWCGADNFVSYGLGDVVADLWVRQAW